ncbi:hypothetical protein DI487_15955 [Flavobacterium sediminis]|uniref:Uncharacterized protein n=1 Tax=Flavobacterium sediminis TaxID=2201181 RepID=A0A2U8QZF0_9FLAO|nr:hypothetical protein [Flavobacterium sediminis]AWM15205.1 hypothetical protein DI487_15955 [Flavobacterium sediminis]
MPNPRFVYEKIADPDTEFFKFVEQTGTFEYAAITGVNKGKITYLATYTQGGTIFWKPVKAYIPEKSEPTWDDYKGNEEDSDCEDID